MLAISCAVIAVASACKGDDNPNCVAPTSTWAETVYVKPPVRESPANFGTTVAMSADGTTLAVTALARGFLSDPHVDAAGAVFVYQRDGARWRHDTTLRPSPASLEVSFGSSLALSSDGQRLVVTAPYESAPAIPELSPSGGSVFVFDRTASGWKQSARLTRAKEELGLGLGVSLALSGDGARIAVGINQGTGGFGSLRIFEIDGSTGIWKATTDVLPPDASTRRVGAHYGSAVALSSDGKTLVVGNWGFVPTLLPRTSFVTARGPGEVWVYRFVNGGWQMIQKLESSSPSEGGEFGYAVSTSADGHAIAVGASEEDTVHVFREDDGHWNERTRLTSPSPNWWRFGFELALSGDGSRLVVGDRSNPTTAVGTGGSLCAPTDGGSNGVVYGFTDDGRSFDAFLRPAVHHKDAAFGLSLALSGDGRSLAVGAFGEDSAALGVDGDQNDHSAPNAGAVYLFHDGRP